MRFWAIVVLIVAMLGACRTQGDEYGALVLKIIDVSAAADTKEITVHAILTNKGETKVKLEKWIEAGWWYNLDLTLSPQDGSAPNRVEPIKCSGTSRSVVRWTSIVIAQGQSVALSAVFNPKRDSGSYNLAVSLRGMPGCVSESRKVMLMESKGQTK